MRRMLELAEYAPAALRGHSGATFRVSKRVKNAPRQGIGVRGRGEESGGAVNDQFGRSADRGGHYRRARRHRFHHRVGQPFAQRGQNCDIESGGDQCGVTAVAQQMHAVIDAKSRGLLLDLAPERAVADQQEMRFRFDSRDSAGGFDEVAMPFDRLQPRDESDQFRAFVQVQLSQQRRALFCAAAVV